MSLFVVIRSAFQRWLKLSSAYAESPLRVSCLEWPLRISPSHSLQLQSAAAIKALNPIKSRHAQVFICVRHNTCMWSILVLAVHCKLVSSYTIWRIILGGITCIFRKKSKEGYRSDFRDCGMGCPPPFKILSVCMCVQTTVVVINFRREKFL